MSIEAINAAWLANVRPAPKKLVLLCLANMHNGQTGQLNPSMATVARACGMSPRQAQRHVHELIDAGLLTVVGNHNGGNPHASRRYRLNLEELIHTGDVHDTGDTNDTGDIDDARGDTDDTPRVTPMTRTGDTHDTQTRKNQKKNQNGTGIKARTRADSIECPPGVDQKVWTDFMAIRKAKRAPMTQTALDGIQREASKAGLTLQQALTSCIEWNWQGFDADWYAKRTGGTLNKQEALEQRNRAVADSWLSSQGQKPIKRRMPEPENWHLKNYGTGGLL